MSDTRPRLTPGEKHPITVTKSDSHVVVRAGSVVVADTERALELREADYPVVFYVPRADVDEAALGRSEHHTYCPFKGEASYFDLTADGHTLPGAIWYYPDPFPAVADIRDHLAFYADRVTITTT